MGRLKPAELCQAEGGVCEYAYSPALAEKLHDPKVFALINLNIQRRFTSGTRWRFTKTVTALSGPARRAGGRWICSGG